MKYNFSPHLQKVFRLLSLNYWLKRFLFILSFSLFLSIMAPPVLAAPSGGSITYQATNISKADQVLSLTVNNGATTGTVSPSLLRRETTLVQGTCGTTYSTWETVPYAGTIPNITTTNFTQEKCYQFSWQVADDSGTTSFPSTTVITTKPNIIPLQTVAVGKAIFVKLNENNLFVALNPLCDTPTISTTKHVFEGQTNVLLTALPDGVAGSCIWSADNDDLSDATYLDTNHCLVRVSPSEAITYTVTMQNCTNTATVTLATPDFSRVMQGWSDCDNYATPDANGATNIGQLIDARDGKSYEIRKMPDGKCWMVDNLAYGGGLDGYSDYCHLINTTNNWREATSSASVSAVATNGLNPANGSRNVFFGQCTNIVGSDNYCTSNGHCGYLYNWPALLQEDNAYCDSRIAFPGRQQGLCPYGWHVPTKNDFVVLDKAFGGTGTTHSNDLAFINAHYLNANQFKGSAAGWVNYATGLPTDVGEAFFLWTSTWRRGNASYNFYIDLTNGNNNILPADASRQSYAFSVRCIADTVDESQTMQNWDDCDNYATPASTTATRIGSLTDSRDGKEYEIRKMPDGKCWMVDNLAYGGGTDGSSDYCAAKTTTDGWRNATAQALVSATAANGLNPTDGSRNTLFGNCSNVGHGQTVCANGDGTGIHQCGYLYNWSAALQSTDAYYGSTATFDSKRQGLCPDGWHLPASSEWTALDTAFGGTGDSRSGAQTFIAAHYLNSTQFKGLYSGYTYNTSGSSVGMGTDFRLWSNTYNSAANAHYLYMSSGGYLTPAAYNYKNFGFSVRCVKDNAPTSMMATTTMQEWDDCGSYATPDADRATMIGYLQDSRDGKSYEIRKMPDGQCWMVDNLRYGGGTDGSSDYCAAKTTTDGWRNATTQALASAAVTNGLNPTDGSRNTLVGNCSNIGVTNSYCATGVGSGRCGYYYNWSAAMQSDLAYYGSTTTFAEPRQGICPSGWHLPKSTDFSNLDKAMGGSGANRTDTTLAFVNAHYLNQNQFKGLWSGYVDYSSGGAYYQGSEFLIWNSTYHSGPLADYLSIGTSGILYPLNVNYKSYGFLVRCIKN